MQSELLFLTLCTHDHCVNDCLSKCAAERGKVDFSMRGLRTVCSTADWILIHNIYSCLYFQDSNNYIYMTNIKDNAV